MQLILIPAKRTDMDAIFVKQLSMSFGKGAARRDALKKISLEIPAGSMTALIGPDGAGKTTLLRLLAGILCLQAAGCATLHRPRAAAGPDAAAEPAAVRAAAERPPPLQGARRASQRLGASDDH